MYSHHLARFNYTTYDVRRAQDVINPSTCHCDIMLLANTSDIDSRASHPFLYARVLGIYHVNVIYTGGATTNYNAQKVYFLWVRWFEYEGTRSLGWDNYELDSVRFPPMADEHAFGFVDPNDVLRGCHVIPTFSGGRVHLDGVGLSHCARDGLDWAHYRINRCVTQHYVVLVLCVYRKIRFVDRDMIMRYHWGLGIGHIYSHGQIADASTMASQHSDNDAEPETSVTTNVNVVPHHDENDAEVDNPELCSENHQDCDLGDAEEGSENEPDTDDDDELLVTIDDMYGTEEAFDSYE